MPFALAIARPVHCVASPGCSVQVSATTWRTVASPGGALPGLRAASRNRPSTPGFREAPLPAPHRRPADPGAPRHLGRPQDDPSPRHVLLGAVAIGYHRLQPSALRNRDQGANDLSHALSIPHLPAVVNPMIASVHSL